MQLPLIWTALIVALTEAIPSRLRRDQAWSEGGRPNRVSQCQLNCDAQFRRDFHMTFSKAYETEFFDFPIDPLISSSRSNFDSFCRLVNETLECYREECNSSTEIASTHSHICVQKRTDFEAALNCLNQTSRQMNCHTGCSRMARRSINETEEESETRGMIEVDVQSFHEQNLRCRFQACTLECRDQLIRNHCSASEAEQTLRTVRHYYTSDLTSDWHEFRKDSKAHLFSRFCRRMLNDQDDELSSYNREYEKTMEQIRLYVRSAVEHC
ncbi:hypothetical protein M3Y94_00818600 [Aphelenchoides besseyi]|nr:hypothetical protein M3Y94_00818600 [Aphelenchoides besseyi]KAI6227141.1 hypothetical protein M3Y95_00695200 [Aphelenchoides besseyi]